MKRPGAMIREVLKHVAAKPATELYPYVRPNILLKFRGKIVFFANKCIGCKMCERDCPTGAIKIHKIVPKRFEAVVYHDKCIYCGQCVDSCPVDALDITTEFELAEQDRKKLTEVFHGAPETPASTEAEDKPKDEDKNDAKSGS